MTEATKPVTVAATEEAKVARKRAPSKPKTVYLISGEPLPTNLHIAHTAEDAMTAMDKLFADGKQPHTRKITVPVSKTA